MLKLYELLGFATYHNMPKITEEALEYTDTQTESRVSSLLKSLKRDPLPEIKNDSLI